jgi:RNA polymerase sigma-54 factor
MALVPRLDLRHVQTLVMTPQLQQAIKLLQLNNIELANYIEQELEQNPLLEREDPDGAPTPEENSADAGSGGDSEDYGGDTDAFAASAEEGFDQPDSVELVDSQSLSNDSDASLDTDFENVWNSDSPSDTPGGGGGEGDTLYWQVSGGNGLGDDSEMENAPSEAMSLRDHLIGQINVDIGDAADRLIALHLVDLLDDAGYITAGLDRAAATLGCTQAALESVLDRVQRFDPPGIFARNLSECLALQLRDRDRYDPAMQALVENLDLLARREFKQLRRLCGVDGEDLSEMVTEIKALNPKPAMAFDHTVAQVVIPDVIVRADGAGGWLVEVNNDTLPRVLVNNRYYAEINRKTARKSEKEYIAECFHSANWLVKALHQRAQTILKVATELVKQQEDFFNRGIQHLRPLVLRDVATAVEVHESTVSRVTNNKYMATPRGIYEMKYFFTFAVGENEVGDAHSAESIRFRIKAMIERESVDDVLSDDKIVSLLRADGVDVARRTVAKYRESMHIPSSVQRRREKALHA